MTRFVLESETSGEWFMLQGIQVVNRNYLNERQTVSRIIALDEGTERSFIYKTNMSEIAFRVEQFVRSDDFQTTCRVHIPRLLDAGYDTLHDGYWMSVEDIGFHGPDFSITARERGIRQLVSIHQYPTDALLLPTQTYMPSLLEMYDDLRLRQGTYRQALAWLGLSPFQTNHLFEEIWRMERALLQTEMVVAHGDFHPLNLAFSNETLYIMDWEFLQKHSIFLDLYLLLDQTDPSYRIRVTPSERIYLLEAYLDERAKRGWPIPSSFIHLYHLFAAIYALRLVPFVAADMESHRFVHHQLALQKTELELFFTDWFHFLSQLHPQN